MASVNAMRPLENLVYREARRLPLRRQYTTALALRDASNHLPRVAQPSFWASLIPKPFRRPANPAEAAERERLRAARPKGWNPATVFIILGLVVGSNAINLIALRNEMLNFSRKTDAKLALLREVIQKVKEGEDVDVKRALGTGDAREEAEWEEVVKELESTDMLWEGRKNRELQRAKKSEQVQKKEEDRTRQREGLSKARQESSDGTNSQRPKFLM